MTCASWGRERASIKVGEALKQLHRQFRIHELSLTIVQLGWHDHQGQGKGQSPARTVHGAVGGILMSERNGSGCVRVTIADGVADVRLPRPATAPPTD
jgi:hypothetical protein